VRDDSKRNWFGAVFGMVFVFAGLAAVYGSAGKMIGGYLSSSDWVSVPVAIHSLDLKKHYGDATTYSIEASYSFEYLGARYTNDGVSLSSDSDNIGKYWQNLYTSLQYDQSINETSAFVNPNNPEESVLDRTIRWKSLIFGSMFLLLFCGMGGLITWASLRKGATREERLSNERLNGIPSDEKYAHWAIGGFGSIFFIFGASFSAIILPDAIRDGEYGALFVLVFVAIGIAIMGYAVKSYFSYRKFGATPLSLDPLTPCVGGQFGSSFEIHLPSGKFSNSSITKQPTATAQLRCTEKTRSKNNTYRSLVWHEETDVYLQQSANGYRGEVIFKIPDNVPASSNHSSRKTIKWQLEIKGDFGSELGKIERSWSVEVLDEAGDVVGAKTSGIVIPEIFQANSNKAASDRAKNSALTQIPLTEDSEYIHLVSDAKRHRGSKLGGIVFGCIFSCVGLFTVTQDWWPGYLFILIGTLAIIASIYQLGKSIEVKIEKRTAILYARESWMGMVYSRTQAQINRVINSLNTTSCILKPNQNLFALQTP